jgi:hypothetical protein
MVNPLCPEPPLSSAPVPRLSWDDKWMLYKRSRKPGYRLLLEQLLEQEDALHKCAEYCCFSVTFVLFCVILFGAAVCQCVRSRKPGYRLLLEQLLEQEDALHK